MEAAPGVFVPVGPGITLNPNTGQIAQIEVDFVNAGAIETDGLDLAFGYSLPTGSTGTLSADLTATLITSFDVSETQGAPFVDRLGNRNVTSFARSTPHFRGNLALGWEAGQHRVTAIARYTSSYDDDLNSDARIDDLLTLDLQYALTLQELFGGAGETRLRIGAINITDEDPPFVFDRGGYDPLVGDPRGRLVYVGISQGF
jgi:iron complex outermembrane receptor protein